MLLAMLLFSVIVGGAALYLIVRTTAAIRQWREPTTHWARRSARDRRRRTVPVRIDRRKAPRREEDVARQFVTSVERHSPGMAAAR